MKLISTWVTACVFICVLSVMYFSSYRSGWFSDWPVKNKISAGNVPEFESKVSEVPTVMHKNVQLTPTEQKQYEICLQTVERSRVQSNNAFWPVQMIRVTSHHYLTNQSLVLDVGGNVGFDANQFLTRYGPKMIVFEPLPSYYNRLVKRFKRNPQVKVLNVGLGKANMELHMEVKGHDGDASSIYTGKNVTGGEIVKVRKTEDVMQMLGLIGQPIDLLHINCEGCEYDVIETVVQSSLVYQMRHIQFATHKQYTGAGDVTSRYCRLIEALKRTHKPMYRFAFLWESWELMP